VARVTSSLAASTKFKLIQGLHVMVESFASEITSNSASDRMIGYVIGLSPVWTGGSSGAGDATSRALKKPTATVHTARMTNAVRAITPE